MVKIAVMAVDGKTETLLMMVTMGIVTMIL